MNGGGQVGERLRNLSTKWNSQNTRSGNIADAGHYLPIAHSFTKF